MVHDKSGKELEVGQLVDIQIPQLATGLVLAVRHTPISTPDGQEIPAHVQIQFLLTVPAARDGGVWCYVVKDAPSEEKKDGVVTPFKVH